MAEARSTLDELLASARARIRRYTPEEAHAAQLAGATLVDIRGETARARDGVVPGALHIPRTVLEWRVAPDSSHRTPYVGGVDTELLLLCDHGCSTILAAATLVELGFTSAGDVIGGFEAWKAAGLPTLGAPRREPSPGALPGTGPPD